MLLPRPVTKTKLTILCYPDPRLTTVAYDRRTGQIVLTFTREVERMDEERFKAVLGDVLDVAIDLHDKLDEIPAPAEPTPTETPPPWGLRL